MKPFQLTSLKYEGGILYALDQRLLPAKEVWIPTRTPQDVILCIKQLSIRGAPLIGVAAASSLALFSQTGPTRKSLLETAQALRDSRPTAVNLMWAIDRMVAAIQTVEDSNVMSVLTQTAEDIIREDMEMCDRMASFGNDLVQPNEGILTHCNTGGLATAGIGTALGVILKAYQSGKGIHVFIDETRPLLQGGRLTAWECTKNGIPSTLLCDNMAASLLRTGRVHRIFVGADRIALNGDFANKIGTYALAIAAHHHKVPFYVVAPTSTVDIECPNGEAIPIEQRADAEVCGYLGFVPQVQTSETLQDTLTQIRWAPEGIKTYNPAFDVTPVQLVTGYILESGVYTPEQIAQGCLKDLVRKATN